MSGALLLRFDPPLVRGTLVRRYQRFLADVRLADGREVTAHCPDPGAMLSLAVPGSPVALSEHDDPRRKLAFTWEMVERDGIWVGIHTGRSNRLVERALSLGAIPELAGLGELRREVTVGGSRLDFGSGPRDDGATFDAYLEVKTVTLAARSSLAGCGPLAAATLAGCATLADRSRSPSPPADHTTIARFPDAKTLRGQKHLRTLIDLAARGHRAILLFFVARGDCAEFHPADEIDPEYGILLRRAAQAGVEVYAWRARVEPKQVTLERSIPTVL